MAELLEEKTAISLKWVFKTKFVVDWTVLKDKACLLTKGYAQQCGIDFKEKIFPVSQFEIVILVLALVA